MSVENRLREEMGISDSENREKILRRWAKECVEDFMERCQTTAKYRKAFSFSNAAINKSGVIHVLPDDQCTPRKMTDGVTVKISEAENFQKYIQEEFAAKEVSSAQIKLEQASITLTETGLFGIRRQVRRDMSYYKIWLSLSW